VRASCVSRKSAKIEGIWRADIGSRKMGRRSEEDRMLLCLKLGHKARVVGWDEPNLLSHC
jgi:hypothetical protein